MKKAIIFGCGNLGRLLYFKVKDIYEILYYADNNKDLWGEKINGIEIINPEKIRVLKLDEIIVSIFAYEEVAEQLFAMGKKACVVSNAGLLFRYDEDRILKPFRVDAPTFGKKEKEYSILFVQMTACIRTHKIAALMKENGWKTALAYSVGHPAVSNPEYLPFYDDIISINDIGDFIDGINQSDFDIIHSSNEPDFLTNLLLTTNKKVIHDVHDLISIYKGVSCEGLILEHIANVKAHGVIYTSEGAKEIAKQKFDISEDKLFVLENRPDTRLKSSCRYEKISAGDGEIHCVYEGGIGIEKESFRYYETIWKEITDEGIHIHFYSSQNKEYCINLSEESSYLHYEGDFNSQLLASEMTKYDCGLVILNTSDKNRMYLETSSPNKLYEYWNAGLPVVVGDIKTHAKLVEKYHGGIQLNRKEEIRPQLEKAREIKISNTFLEDNCLYMNQYALDLINFYKRIIQS